MERSHDRGSLLLLGGQEAGHKGFGLALMVAIGPQHYRDLLAGFRPDVVHVEGKVSPSDDIETINTELILADMASLEKRRNTREKKAKGKLKLNSHEAIMKGGEDGKVAGMGEKNRRAWDRFKRGIEALGFADGDRVGRV